MKKRLTPFFLRTPDKHREKAPLYIRVQDKSRGIDLKFCTDIRADTTEWLSACADERSFVAHRIKYRDLHQKLWQIECLANEVVSDVNFNKDKLHLEILKISGSSKYAKQIILKAEEDEAMQELKRVQTDYRDAEKEKAEAQRSNIWNFIVRFCDEIESGIRRYGSERYTAGSVKSWKSFKNLYDRFDPHHRYT